MHKKTRKIQLYHIRDKAENIQRITNNRGKGVCVCVLGYWVVFGVD